MGQLICLSSVLRACRCQSSKARSGVRAGEELEAEWELQGRSGKLSNAGHIPWLPPATRPPGLAVNLEDLSWRRAAVRSRGRGSY